uniref:Uncharacterized protein n=1 Tax=Acrobeloides nanus TaxID=290746 RepID=A0A914EPZ9_9BILA
MPQDLKMDRTRSDTVQSSVVDMANLKDDFPLYYCDKELNKTRKSTKNDASNRAQKVLMFASVLLCLFIMLEVAGGYLAHSLAIMTDAFHMISDLASFMISILAIHLAKKQPTNRFSFGYQRAEVLGALTSKKPGVKVKNKKLKCIIIVWILTLILVYLAIVRIIHGDYEIEADTMMVTAGIGVIFNIIMGFILYFGKTGHTHFGVSHSHEHGSHVHPTKNGDPHIEVGHHEHKGHGHDHGHDHGHGHGHGQENLNIRAAFVHVLGDLVQSLGVLVAAIIIKFTHFELADPICTFLFSVLVLITTAGVAKDTIRVLMEAAPTHIDIESVQTNLLSIKGVEGVHSMRIWSLKMDSTSISVHLETIKDADLNHIVYQAHKKLQHEHGIEFVTVQAQCASNSRSNSVCTHSTEIETLDVRELTSINL